VLGKC
jgi:hypothetical protein